MTKMRYAIGLTLPALAACTAIVDGNPAPTETLSSATASAGSGAGGSTSTSTSVSVAGGGSGSSAGSTPVTPVTPVDPSSNGLPCDVTALLQHYCVGCHSSPPSGGAPEALASYANLVAAAKTDATKKVGVLSVSMMQSGVMPPKPAAAPTASEQATFQAWISAGMPQTACTTAVDAGVVATNPYDTPLTCTSNKNWTRGDNGSASMHPGVPCISCHAKTGGEAPRYSIAGTIYPSAHEPDNCNGSSSSGSGNLSVLITEANGTTHTLSVNSVGNFYYQGSIATPYTARVQAGSAVRVMTHTQTFGDCNGCHTVNGASTVAGAANAPGRIMSP